MHFRRSPSPREIDDLPEAFHCGSPRAVSSALPAASSGSRAAPRMDLEWTSLQAGQSSSSSSHKKRPRDEVQRDAAAPSKGKGKQKQEEEDAALNDDHEHDCTMDHDHGLASFEEMGLPISLANASLPPQHNHRPHHPQNEQITSQNGASPFTGFGVKGTPGGDCKRICLRHQRMVDAGARLDLQKVCLSMQFV